MSSCLLDICQLGEVWSKVELYPERGPFQCDSSDQQDDQHHVREGGGDVNYLENINHFISILVCRPFYLPTRFYSLDETAEYDDPSRHQTQSQLPIGSPKVSSLDTGTFLQYFLTEILPRA